MATPDTPRDSAVTQYAVLDALLTGAYVSGMPVTDALERGDFGIGCCERLGGEVVILDGQAFECTVDAPPRRMTEDEILPFLDVCTFDGGAPHPISDADDAALRSRIEERLVSRNLFHAVRVDGVFRTLTVRVTRRQADPFRPLAEAAGEQVETVVDDVSGTLLGFWAPAIYQGITVAGLHLHFVSDDRSVGGHVLRVVVDEAELRLAAYARFHLHLPRDEHFLATELTHTHDHRIAAIEAADAAS